MKHLLNKNVMNKLILILSMTLLSCEAKPEEKKNLGANELSKETENYYQRVIEYKYEGCEYIKVGFGKSIWGSHKGNCSNPIHRAK